MNEVVSRGGGEDAVVLEGGGAVSMQLLQQVYREVTGKTERIAKQFDVNHRTDFADLENLNAKIEQLLEQYHVKERVCTVVFFHTDDCSERFSSFDRARAYEVGSNSPIENVRIEYNLLIVLPVAKKPQPYKLVIDVHSRAAIRDKLKDGNEFQRMIGRFDRSTGAVSIDYVDYAVARTMLTAVGQWFESLDSKATPSFLKLARKYSHNLPWILKYSTSLVVAYGYWKVLHQGAPEKIAALGMYAIVAFSSVFIVSGLANRVGSYLDGVISEMEVPSYLDLNKGDRKVIERSSLESNFRWLKVAASTAAAVLLNIFSSWLANKVGISS